MGWVVKTNNGAHQTIWEDSFGLTKSQAKARMIHNWQGIYTWRQLVRNLGAQIVRAHIVETAPAPVPPPLPRRFIRKDVLLSYWLDPALLAHTAAPALPPGPEQHAIRRAAGQ